MSIELTSRLAECTALLLANYALVGRGEAGNTRNGTEGDFLHVLPGSRFDGNGGMYRTCCSFGLAALLVTVVVVVFGGISCFSAFEDIHPSFALHVVVLLTIRLNSFDFRLRSWKILGDPFLENKIKGLLW